MIELAEMAAVASRLASERAASCEGLAITPCRSFFTLLWGTL
jgi:hypothetical protein